VTDLDQYIVFNDIPEVIKEVLPQDVIKTITISSKLSNSKVIV
jgi:hypothetical protein